MLYKQNKKNKYSGYKVQKSKLHHSLYLIFLSTISLSTPLSAVANDNNESIDEPFVTLDPIIITATKTDKKLSETPILVNLISQQNLKENKIHTLKEAIELLPNVVLKEVHGKAGYEVIMQGLSSDQVLVLVDGLPLTASTGSTVNLNQYLNIEVEQIEVIQGASSSQYGSSAMGGVINVITKKLTSQESPISAHVTAEIATNGKQNPSANEIDTNTVYVEAGLDGRLDKEGKLQARITASQLQDEGLSLDTEKWARIKGNSEQLQVSARLQFQPEANSDSQFWTEATYYQEDNEGRLNRRVAQNIIPRQNLEEVNKQRYSVGFNHTFDKESDRFYTNGKLQAKLFYEKYEGNSNAYSVNNLKTQEKTISINRDTVLSTKIAQSQYDFPQLYFSDANSHYLQVGGQWQQDDLIQTNNGKSELTADKVQRDVAELYIQDDWLFADNWELLTGIRYQQDSDFGDHIAPKIAIKYDMPSENNNEHVFRASIGQGYRVPNLKERHFVFDHSVYGYMVKGNPDLLPETSDSYQLGYQGIIGEDVQLTANIYYNKVKDLIQTDRNAPLIKDNIAIYHYENIDSATTYGGDLGMVWTVDDNNQLQTSYAYSHTQNDAMKTSLAGRPEHQVSISLNNKYTDKINVINRVKYQSKHLVSTGKEAYSPNFWTWDTKLNYQLSPNFSAYAGINNLFDQQRDFKDPNDQGHVDNRQWLLGASLNY